MMMFHVMGFPILLATLFWVVVLALLVFSVYVATRSLRTGATTHRLESPAEMLDRRFAAGEIDTDEYYERRAGLRP